MSKTMQTSSSSKPSTAKSKTEMSYKSFFEVFYKNVPKEDKDMMAPESLSLTAKTHLALTLDRAIGKKPAIQIITPTAKSYGWDARRTIIDIVNDDMAFLVDSVVAELIRNNYQIAVFVHPILHARLSADKKQVTGIYAAPEKNDALHAQSHIHIELSRVLSPKQMTDLHNNLERVLADARLANRDWPAMRGKIDQAKKVLESAKPHFNPNEIQEYQDFLDYLFDNNFTFLGYREYEFSKSKTLKSKIVEGSSLGLLSDEREPVFINEARKSLSEYQQEYRITQDPLTICKVNRRSTVHRRVPMDAVAIKKYDAKGQVIGEYLFVGLFTSVTYSRSVMSIPYLRMKVDNVVKRSRFANASHNYKALRHILEKYPRDEILQMSEKLLYQHSISILRLQERPSIALYTRDDAFGRYISCLIYVPREKYDTRLRQKFQKILSERLGGTCHNFKVQQDDSPLARVLIMVDINKLEKAPKYDPAALERELIDAGQSWAERLTDTIDEKITNPAEAAEIIRDYAHAFPVNYHDAYSPVQAVLDIQKIKSVLSGTPIALELFEEKVKKDSGEAKEIHLKLYRAGSPLALSDVLPIMENMGLNVITEHPFAITPAGSAQTVWIHDFLIEGDNPALSPDVATIKNAFEDVFQKTWNDEMESDSLNMMAFTANMPWQDIMILRAYVHYLRQTGIPFSLPYIESAVTTYPAIAAELVRYFKNKFDPAAKKMNKKAEDSQIESIIQTLDKVDSLDHDRIFRRMIGLIKATLRTNFFQPDKDGHQKTYLSFKLDSRSLPELPDPKPYREIFVYAARVEGVHLRADQIARGGLRWSDRHEDFRTEVLGLMKAQQVKNAVIVPMGAKGGFVVKKPPQSGDRAAYLAEGIECYKIFIRGLLDITDNRKGEEIVPPAHVVRYDSDDPYFVVAADKGTATFSDIANSLSLEYGFWLGDAFASGGSAGYDHKKMGITARGAWESVKRHFRELGHDIQTKDFSVIGVGDMAGDVFGNGMLLSPHIRLIGAFNHVHIFCDPNPNTVKTFAERKRLFTEVKGWDHYDQSLLSKGGRIFSRKDKNLKLTPEIQKAFDIAESEVSPNVLIRAMLKAKTDLLWFGGIGTYVKATQETHADVGDKGNDSLRINATEIRARVIGEGANLAITQAARIEYAMAGGRLNADYIDNAGGVASSDDEVNIKILMGDVMRKGKYKMDVKARNKLLESMTDDVAQHVLRGNYQQSQGISLMALQAPQNLQNHANLIHYLKKKVGLSRTLEKLPQSEEIEKRLHEGKGLTRPELSVLQSYAKICYTQDLLNSDIPDSKAMEERLFRYFPPKLSKLYPKEILGHRLKREIIAMTLANGIVNRMGPDFIRDRMERCGASCEEVARAYIIVREAFGLRDIWNEIEALDGKVDAMVQLNALRETSRMTERAVTWFLTRYGRKLDILRDVAHFEGGIKTVKKHLDQVVPKDLLKKINDLTQTGVQNGLPRTLARDISLMPILGSACDIIRISVDHKFDIPLTASVYFDLGGHFHMDWMRHQARQIQADDRWTAQALEGLVDQLYTCQAGLTIQILKHSAKLQAAAPKGKAKDKQDSASLLQQWISDRGEQARLLDPLFAELRRSPALDLSMIIIAEQRLRNLYGG